MDMELSRIDIIGQNGPTGEHYYSSISIHELIESVGYRGALALSYAYGGSPLQVPATFQETSAIALSVGPDVAEKLVESFRGERLEIPSQSALIREQRNAEIVRLYHTGETISELARLFGLSRRMVSKIITDAIERSQRRAGV